MDKNDRNNSDNTRQRQSFHRNPQRPPAPDYRSRQRDNSPFERAGERPVRQDGTSRMNPRQGQNARTTERQFDLPDRYQQRMDPREAILNEELNDKSRFSRDPGLAGRQTPQGRQRDSRTTGREDWQREPGNYSRRNDGQRAPRRFDSRDSGRGSSQNMQENQRDRRRSETLDTRQEFQNPRDNRRPDSRNSARQNGQNDRRDRAGNPSRSLHDDDFYSTPRASDPRRRDDRSTRYDGMGEGSIDLGTFDINYKGDSNTSRGFKSPAVSSSLLGKPMILGVFAVSAALITIVIFAVVARGNKPKTTDDTGTESKYEYKIPDTVTIGGTVINTDADYIELAEMNLTDIKDLSHCYLVNSLFINGNSISDISPISDCISLKTIDANSNQISDISALKNLNQLEDIDVSANQVTDLSPLSNLKNLERLSADKNQISDLTPLADCSSLRQLIVSDNSITDLLPIAGLSNLTTLESANNQISDISPLGTLTNISTLNLSGNKISDIKSLKKLSSLTMLDLSGNPISDVSALSGLKGLLELNLTDTKVSKEDFAQLQKDLSGCTIRK